MVVVIGNNIMYQICSDVSDHVGWHYRGQREACYMIFYTVACTFNIIVDLVVTYYMASYIMQGIGFRTYYGTKLQDIDSFPEHFETYAIQRTMAENIYAYAWPATFLIPFALEPVMTILLPFYLAKLFV